MEILGAHAISVECSVFAICVKTKRLCTARKATNWGHAAPRFAVSNQWIVDCCHRLAVLDERIVIRYPIGHLGLPAGLGQRVEAEDSGHGDSRRT
jgi:hypothetical protein